VNADASLAEVSARLACFVRLATESDDVADVVAAAWTVLRRPIAVVDASGNPLARAPGGSVGHAALVAARAGEGRTDAEWSVAALRAGRERLGSMAVHVEPAAALDDRAVVDAVRALIAGQLHRLALSGAARREHAKALERRLVRGATLTAATARREAEAAGIRLADFYWALALVSERGELSAPVLSGINDLVRRYAPGSLTVAFDERMTILLLADAAAGNGSRREASALLEHAVSFAHGRQPLLGVWGMAAERSVAVVEVPEQVRLLDHMRDFPRCVRGDGPLVVGLRHLALHSLLCEGLDRARALEFVRRHLGHVLEFDRVHHSDLTGVLELALDHPHRDEAARRSYMHRNTFRRRLRQAVELVDCDLEDPDERLALHVALKLRKVVHQPGGSRPLGGRGSSGAAGEAGPRSLAGG
jgi:hypothetical protein